jgi:glycosyltransferase involved in cell wall biosynthesis
MDAMNPLVTNARVEPVPPPPRAVSVVVPAYNEEHGIRPVLTSLLQTLSALQEVTYEIIVVDDGSTDGTSEAVRDLPGVSVVRHDSNRGYGAALKTGMRHARYEWICITDADGTYPNERIGDLLAATDSAHMVVGARTAPGVQDSWLRRLPRTFLRRYAEWVTRRKIADMNSGLRVFRKDLAERFFHLLPDGFSFTTTITIALIMSHYTVRYLPIGYARRVGKSKIDPIGDTLRFLVLILRTGMYFAPLRTLVPPTVALFLLFVGSAAYDILCLHNLTDKTLILLVLSMNTGTLALVADMIHKRGSA